MLIQKRFSRAKDSQKRGQLLGKVSGMAKTLCRAVEGANRVEMIKCFELLRKNADLCRVTEI